MSDTLKGFLAMLGACLIWGGMPLIYKPLVHVPSEEVLAHRVIWSLVFFALLLWAQNRISTIPKVLATRAQIGRTMLAAAMISVNWFLLIFATAIGRNTETSLGYYIYPLLAVLCGAYIFGERMSAAQKTAAFMALVAVCVLTYGIGAPPWIALALGLTFAWYGVIKKQQKEDALVSVTGELVVVLPVAIGLLIWAFVSGQLVFGSFAFESVYMLIAGPLTALPLILFSYAAQRIRMSTLGLMQYINPTLQFLTAVVLFGEVFTPWHAVAFALIWSALALYSVSAWRQDQAFRRKARAASGVSTT